MPIEQPKQYESMLWDGTDEAKSKIQSAFDPKSIYEWTVGEQGQLTGRAPLPVVPLVIPEGCWILSRPHYGTFDGVWGWPTWTLADFPEILTNEQYTERFAPGS
jgi:hypothetical protein